MYSDPRVAQALWSLKCAHPNGFRHAEIKGATTVRTGYYPSLLCRALLRGIVYTPNDSWHVAPAMPVVAQRREQREHRENESKDTVSGMYVGFGGSSSSSSSGSRVVTPRVANTQADWCPSCPSSALGTSLPRIYGAVTKFLNTSKPILTRKRRTQSGLRRRL